MDKQELGAWTLKIADEVTRRKALGGYSADAGAILLLTEAVAAILDHLRTAGHAR